MRDDDGLDDPRCICPHEAWDQACPVHTPGPSWPHWKTWETELVEEQP